MQLFRLDNARFDSIPALPAERNHTTRKRSSGSKWNPQMKPEFQEPYRLNALPSISTNPLEFEVAEAVLSTSSTKQSSRFNGSGNVLSDFSINSGDSGDSEVGILDTGSSSEDTYGGLALQTVRSAQRRLRSPFAPSREPERESLAYNVSLHRVTLSRDPVSDIDEPAPLPNPGPVVRPQPTPSLSHNRSTMPHGPPPSSSLSTARRNQSIGDASRSQPSSQSTARRNQSTTDQSRSQSSSLSTVQRNQNTDQSRSQSSSLSTAHRSQNTNATDHSALPPSPPNRKRRSMAISRDTADLSGFSTRFNGRNEAIVWRQSWSQSDNRRGLNHTFGYGALWSLKDL